ncbi:MAG: hypothetical protein K8R77_08075 [Anaerolineaceae bacterium]|nr:hypothetical protein [Anaerolineaceae bacterium]
MKKTAKILSKWSTLWVLLYFTAMTVVMTWPLVTRMGSSMVGMVGDNIYFVWMIGWFKKALFDIGVNPFNIWFLNYPQGWSLAYTEITQANLAIAMPFYFIGGEVFAYNMAMMFTFVLSGLGMYLWVKKLSGRWDAALLAGTVYAFLPYHFAHFRIGHLNLSGIQWFPFYFMGLWDVLKREDWSWKPVLIGGIALGLIANTSMYYFYMTALVSVFLVVVYLLMNKPLIKDWAFWKRVLALVLVAVPLVMLAAFPYVSLLTQGGMPDRNMGIVRKYSASPLDFFLPSTDHFLWGTWVGQNFSRDLWIEATLYVGLVSGVLAVLAWVKRKELKKETLLRLLLWGTLLSIVLAMGTDLHWNEKAVEIALPTGLASRLGRDTLPLVLPGYFLFKYFPLYAKLRALMRFGVFALVFVSAAGGLGAAWLLEKCKGKRQAAVLVLLLALVFVDFYPGPYQQFAQVQARPADYWLAEQPGDGAWAQFPFELQEDQEHIYGQLINGKPFLGGFFNAFPPAQYRQIMPVMNTFPSEESVEQLKLLDITYILVDQTYYDNMEEVRQTCEALGLVLLTESGNDLIYGFEQ